MICESTYLFLMGLVQARIYRFIHFYMIDLISAIRIRFISHMN
jgi:hypothetical protein